MNHMQRCTTCHDSINPVKHAQFCENLHGSKDQLTTMKEQNLKHEELDELLHHHLLIKEIFFNAIPDFRHH